ncbi:ligand-binding sensor domain-containing diguanylate cyclase [Novilysobacter spongiicola]|uniref:diguanylate cyclase n=1 Tax=Lysobacter spongiicola DSM 21749 TaxID=1122188 RepID=A0A1T4RCP3_9GAMM|nr:ligand-binding sensor domain-containing diguanylate cyclase [Lysobacter spongiicola]SKA13774.1 diguanylate cyclase (GGDEF) domain-containing protein [Lysobacter spongiicola DSM 21749]
MRILAALLVLSCALWPWAAHALEPDKAFHHYVRTDRSIQHGLPQISVQAITQGGDGYLWVGTQAGLARFDGVRFTSFTPDNNDQLPGAWIRALHTARDGRVWVGSYKGAAVHDGTGLKAVLAADPAAWPSLDIYDITDDAAGNLWVATTSGLFQLRNERLHLVEESSAATFSLLAHDSDLWVGVQGGVRRLSGGRWTDRPLPAGVDSAVRRLVYAQGRLWAATGVGLFTLEDSGWVAFDSPSPLRDTPVEMLFTDRDGNLWAGGDSGLIRIRERQLVESIAPGDPGALAGLRSAYEDREGNLWLGSQWDGLVRFSDSWTRRYSSAEGLNDPIVWSVAPDPDGQRAWVGGNDGVSILEDGRFNLSVPGSALPHPQGYNLLAEEDRLWIGTRHGLVFVDHRGPRAGQVQQPPLLAPMADTQINGIVRDDDGRLWVATTRGLFTEIDGRFVAYGEPEGLADPRVRFFLRGADGTVHAGTQGGLFSLRGGRFVERGRDTGLPPGQDITAILERDDGSLVVGTLADRIYFQHDGRWVRLDESVGMPANSPFFMSEDSGYLWVAGIRGISRVPAQDLAALATGRIDKVRGEMLLNERGDPMSGQQGYCCNGAGNSKGFVRDGTLWLPTRDGVVAMEEASIETNTVPPQMAIERVQVGEQWHPASTLEGHEFEANERDLAFEFTVLSFRDPKSTQLEYRLVGYDDAWRAVDPLNRSTRFTNLPPGDYVLEVRGRNDAGIAAADVASLSFGILPRFHETLVFALLLVLLALLLAYGAYRYLQRRYRLQREALEQLVQQRTRALAAANARLQEASQTDPLTGLRNRRYMASQLPVDLAFYDRETAQNGDRGEVMVFALVDIDHFKPVNDEHGHHVGDRVLQQFAQVLTGLVRTGDYVVRWGGEEFLLVFRPMPPEHLATLGERIRAAAANHVFEIGGDRTLRLTCSVGLAEYPLFRGQGQGQRPSWEMMVDLADKALYYVKTRGRDGWAAFRPTAKTNADTLLRDLQGGPEPLLAEGRLQVLGSMDPPDIG